MKNNFRTKKIEPIENKKRPCNSYRKRYCNQKRYCNSF